MPKIIVLGVLAIAIMNAQAIRADNSSKSSPPPALHALLQIKPGLWEFSETPKVTGATVISDAMLARIPPAERGQYLTQTRKMLGEPSKERECVTQATFDQRVFFAASDCTKTVVANTASRIEVVIECRAERGGLKQYNTRRLVASEPTSVMNSIHSVVTRQRETMTIDNIENGRWLSSNCGEVKGIEVVR